MSLASSRFLPPRRPRRAAAPSLVLFVLLLGVRAAAGQEAPHDRMWSGMVQVRPGAPITAEGADAHDGVDFAADLDLDGLRRALAEIELDLQTKRDVQSAAEALDLLWLGVNNVMLQRARAPLYVEIAAARARFYRSLDRLAEARAALDQLLVAEDAPRLPHWVPWLVDATPEARAAAAAARRDPRLLALAQELDDAMAAQDEAAAGVGLPLARELAADRLAFLTERFGLPTAALDRLVGEMLADENGKGVADLGVRAAPSLALRVLADPEGARLLNRDDPLEVLARVDPAGSLDLILFLLTAGGPSFKQRVLAVEASAGFAWWNDLWLFTPGDGPPSCQRPALQDLAAALIADPFTRDAALGWLPRFVPNGGCSPPMVDAIRLALAEAEQAGALRILALIDANGWIADSLAPVLADGLAHADPAVAATCARLALGQDHISALLSLLHEPAQLEDLMARARDPRLMPRERLDLVVLAARAAAPGAEDLALEWLEEFAAHQPGFDLVRSADLDGIRFADPGREIRFLRRVLAAPAISTSTLVPLLAAMPAADADPASELPALQEEVLRRLIASTATFANQATIARRAITGLASRPLGPAQEELLAAAVTLPGSGDAAVTALAAHDPARYFPLFARLAAEAGSVETRRAAIDALIRLATPEAALALGAALLASDDDATRARIGAGLDMLRRYHDERRYWLRQQVPELPDREHALRELVGMLADPAPAVRAEAARSIAAFAALEAVPALIRALQDPDGAVRDAARAALDRLQKGGAAPPTLLF